MRQSVLEGSNEQCCRAKPKHEKTLSFQVSWYCFWLCWAKWQWPDGPPMSHGLCLASAGQSAAGAAGQSATDRLWVVLSGHPVRIWPGSILCQCPESWARIEPIPSSIVSKHGRVRLFCWAVYLDHVITINPLTAKLFNLNFHPLEDVSRWRDPQLRVSENYSDLTKWRSTLFKSCWLMSHFIFSIFKMWYLMC